jgi:hypothetical protein
MKTTQLRVKGTGYRISNLIKELIAMQKSGVEYIDLEISDNGFYDVETDDECNIVNEEWIEYIEYKFIGKENINE